MTLRESEAMDRAITGNYGEDSVPANGEAETVEELLDRILEYFDLDITKEWKSRGVYTYTVRLWQDGGQVAESSGTDLYWVLVETDRTAAHLVNYW